MREPVSIRAVPITVSEPPSSKTRAEPNSRLGTSMRSDVDAAGHGSAAVAGVLVVGPRQPGQAVEQNEDLPALLGQPFGALDHQLGRADVAARIAVGAAGDHLAADGAAHVGDFLGPLVDEQHDQLHLRMVRRHRLGDVLQQHRLAGARRSHDQAALSPCRSA